MLHRLFICRHAEAQAPHYFHQDFDRPLSEAGCLEAKQTGQWLLERHYHPDIILCSSAQRTLNTAQIIAGTLSYNQASIRAMDTLYNAKAANLLSTLEKLEKNVKSALVVGHNPGVTELVELLSGRELGFVATGKVYHLWFEVPDWTGLNVALSSGYETNQK